MARRGAVAEWLGRGLQSLVHQFDSGRRLLSQVSPPPWVCFHEVNPLREQLEYAVLEAAEKERTAWTQLERVNRPNADVDLLEAARARWQSASRDLVGALAKLKARARR